MQFTRLALDSNIAIPIMNRDRAMRHLTRGFNTLFLPAVVLGELYRGAIKSRDVAKNLEQVRQLTDRCEILPIDEPSAKAWAELRVALESKGRQVPRNDLWIAAVCVANDLPLATRDVDFQDIPGLTIVQY